MADDQKPPVLEYRNLTQSPQPRFKWRLYISGIATAIGAPLLAGILVPAIDGGDKTKLGAHVAFAIMGFSVVLPMIAAIESLLDQRRRAFGLGVFTAYGMALLAVGMFFLWLR